MTANFPLIKRETNKLKRKKAVCTKWDEMEGIKSVEDSFKEEATPYSWPLKMMLIKVMKSR